MNPGERVLSGQERLSLNPFRRRHQVNAALAELTIEYGPLTINLGGETGYDKDGDPVIGVPSTFGLVGRRALDKALTQIGELDLQKAS